MEQKHPIISELVERIRSYGKTTLELTKLRSISKGTDIIANAISIMAVVITTVITLMMANVGLALWIGHLLGEPYLGFLTVAGGYAILALLLAIIRKRWIAKPIRNKLVEMFLKESNHEQA